LGLPQAYYNTNESTAAVRKAYVTLLHQLFMQSGSSENKSKSMAQNVLLFEKQLAAVALTPVEQRNISLTTNMYLFSELPAKFPGIPWNVVSDATTLSAEEIGSVVMDCTRFGILI
jgi:predicted metalloendopeptidase